LSRLNQVKSLSQIQILVAAVVVEEVAVVVAAIPMKQM
jgi:hypothetical protein